MDCNDNSRRSSIVAPMVENANNNSVDESPVNNKAALAAFSKWKAKSTKSAVPTPKKKSCFSKFMRNEKKIEAKEKREQLRAKYEAEIDPLIIYAIAGDSESLLVTIPYMPLKLAYVCAVLNVFLPGCGTIVSAVSLFYCSYPQGLVKRDKDLLQDAFISMLCVGVSQMFTVTFLLVGWIWSLVWGINMVLLAEHHQKLIDGEIHRLKALAIANKFLKL